jgi:hypothetical protein
LLCRHQLFSENPPDRKLLPCLTLDHDCDVCPDL